MWAHAIGKKSQLINDIWHGPRRKEWWHRWCTFLDFVLKCNVITEHP